MNPPRSSSSALALECAAAEQRLALLLTRRESLVAALAAVDTERETLRGWGGAGLILQLRTQVESARRWEADAALPAHLGVVIDKVTPKLILVRCRGELLEIRIPRDGSGLHWSGLLAADLLAAWSAAGRVLP